MRPIDQLILDSAVDARSEFGIPDTLPAPLQEAVSLSGLTADAVLRRWSWTTESADSLYESGSSLWLDYRSALFAKSLKAQFCFDALEEALSDDKARKWLDPGKSVLINNVWWTIRKRDLAGNKVTLGLSDWALADGVKDQPDRTMPFSSLVKSINKGKIGVSIEGVQYGPAQDAKRRDNIRKKAGLRPAPGAAKFRESVMEQAERVGAYDPEAFSSLVESAKAHGRFDSAPVMYRGLQLLGPARKLVEAHGDPAGGDVKSRLSWVASKLSIPFQCVYETFASARTAGLSSTRAFIAAMDFAQRRAFGEVDLDEVESRSDALLQFVLKCKRPVDEFEAWLRDEHPDLAEKPDDLYEAPVQVYQVPQSIRESLRPLRVSGARAVSWQNLVIGSVTHQQLERFVFESVSGMHEGCDPSVFRWAFDAYTKVEESNRSRAQVKEQQDANAVPIPRNVRSRVRLGLMLHRQTNSPVSERDIRLARRLNRCSIPYGDVEKLAHQPHHEVVDENGNPDADTIRYWMRGGRAGVSWAKKIMRDGVSS